MPLFTINSSHLKVFVLNYIRIKNIWLIIYDKRKDTKIYKKSKKIINNWIAKMWKSTQEETKCLMWSSVERQEEPHQREESAWHGTWFLMGLSGFRHGPSCPPFLYLKKETSNLSMLFNLESQFVCVASLLCRDDSDIAFCAFLWSFSESCV